MKVERQEEMKEGGGKEGRMAGKKEGRKEGRKDIRGNEERRAGRKE